MADYTPTTEEVRDALIEGAKLDARNSMRSDPRVWHEALEAALDKVLPGFWDAARASVLAEQGEPEWEYRIDRGDFVQYSRSRSVAVRALQVGRDVRKRTPLVHVPAGPWLPVEENGEDA